MTFQHRPTAHAPPAFASEVWVALPKINPQPICSRRDFGMVGLSEPVVDQEDKKRRRRLGLLVKVMLGIDQGVPGAQRLLDLVRLDFPLPPIRRRHPRKTLAGARRRGWGGRHTCTVDQGLRYGSTGSEGRSSYAQWASTRLLERHRVCIDSGTRESLGSAMRREGCKDASLALQFLI